MSDLLQVPSSSPPAWAARLAVVRASVTPLRVVLAVAGIVAAVAFGLVFLRTPSHPPELVLPKAGDVPPAPATAPGAAPPAGSPSTTAGAGGVGVVTVHAAGQVAAPGVYSVPAGSRVADLVTAAGGLLPEADIDRLNLAAKLVDGTQVYIPAGGSRHQPTRPSATQRRPTGRPGRGPPRRAPPRSDRSTSTPPPRLSSTRCPASARPRPTPSSPTGPATDGSSPSPNCSRSLASARPSWRRSDPWWSSRDTAGRPLSHGRPHGRRPGSGDGGRRVGLGAIPTPAGSGGGDRGRRHPPAGVGDRRRGPARVRPGRPGRGRAAAADGGSVAGDGHPGERPVRCLRRGPGRRSHPGQAGRSPARGGAAARLRSRLAGEQVALAGELRPVVASARRYLDRRHVAAQLVVAEVGRWELGNGPSRLANSIRRTLLAGVASLPPERRALYAGFVLGDDRGQPVEITDDFRAAGLTHLLVVSGQNVAFVLALLSPLLRRLRLGARLGAGLVLLLLFGVLTRWEPSVLRAEAMAGLALLASTMGRAVSGLRILALAVTGLLLIDPLLVGSLGFLLSTGASAGILLLAKPIAALLPGPRPLADALGVTLAAQVGVAPVLVPVFDGLPVASLPANLLAVPVAGPLMMWGIAAGLPAGIVGGPVARIVHVPTEILVAWVAAVARWGAGLPLGRVRLPHLVVLAAVTTAALVGRRRGRRRVVRGCAAAAVAVLLVPAIASRWPPAVDGRALVAGVHLWRQGGATVLVVDGSTTTSGRLLSALHNLDVRRLDVVVTARPGVAAARWIAPVLRRFPAGVLVAPPGHRLAGAVVPAVGSRLVAGPIAVDVDAVSPTLVVRVAGARSPPH